MTKGFKEQICSSLKPKVSTKRHLKGRTINQEPETVMSQCRFPKLWRVLLSLLTDEIFCFTTIFTMFGTLGSAFTGSRSKLQQCDLFDDGKEFRENTVPSLVMWLMEIYSSKWCWCLLGALAKQSHHKRCTTGQNKTLTVSYCAHSMGYHLDLLWYCVMSKVTGQLKVCHSNSTKEHFRVSTSSKTTHLGVKGDQMDTTKEWVFNHWT